MFTDAIREYFVVNNFQEGTNLLSTSIKMFFIYTTIDTDKCRVMIIPSSIGCEL